MPPKGYIKNKNKKPSLVPPESTTFEKRSDEIAATTHRRKRINLNERNAGGIAGYDPEDKNSKWKYHRVNDDPERPGRLEKMIAAGWEVVTDGTDEEGGTLCKSTRLPSSASMRPVGSTTNGETIIGVLMRKPREEVEEDYQVVIDANDQTERNIFGQLHETGGRYGRVEALGRVEERK